MTKDEALKLAREALLPHKSTVLRWYTKVDEALDAIDKVLAQPEQEPVKIAHKHEWFRTGEMKVGQMRCISCGTWGQEEIPQRTWVGLTDEEMHECWDSPLTPLGMKHVRMIEAKLKEKNT